MADTKTKRELDRINTEIAFEDELACASEEMGISELLDKAMSHGEVYGTGYRDGFWAGRELLNKSEIARQESISLKHKELLGQ